MQIIMQIINLQRLKSKFRNLSTVKERREVIRKAARESAKPLHAAIKRVTPKRTGLLKSSIKIRAAKKSRVRVGVNVIIRKVDWAKAKEKRKFRNQYRGKRRTQSNFTGISKGARRVAGNNKTQRTPGKDYRVFYGSFVEMGTKYMTARKFMKKTSKSMRRQVINDFIQRTFKLIKDLVK